MSKNVVKISFQISKQELELLDDIIILDQEVQDSIDNAVLRGKKYELAFSYRALDELAGSLASATNHEKATRKQDRLDNLCDKVESFLKLCQELRKISNLNDERKKSKHSNKSLKELLKINMRRKKAKARDKLLVFEVSMDERRDKDHCIREISILGSQSLYNFAEAIVKSFDFYFDHCFGFYDNLKSHTRSKVGYELFPDIGEEPFRGSKGVKKTKVSEAFRNIGDKMLFFFDYGDSWHFIVELKELREAAVGSLFPVLSNSIGEPPLQYPPIEEGNFE